VKQGLVVWYDLHPKDRIEFKIDGVVYVRSIRRFNEFGDPLVHWNGHDDYPVIPPEFIRKVEP
jgi:hypothetical protein